MTSAVLILSMLPVALQIGDSGSGRAPLGAVLVGGMTTSTFLSLLYVPVAYTYFDSVGTLFGRLIRWRPGFPSRRRGAQNRAIPAEAPRRGAAAPGPAVGGTAARGALVPVSHRPPTWRVPRWQPRSIRERSGNGHAELVTTLHEPSALRRAG